MSAFGFSRTLLFHTIVGLVIGSVAGATLTDIGAMVFALVISGYEPASSQSLLAMLAGAFGFGAVRGAFLVLPVAVFAGWPLHLLLMRIGWVGMVVYSLTWAAIMLAAYLIAPSYMGSASTGWLLGIPLSTGFIAGSAFWLIRRPDRDIARTRTT